ncbi:hypothetical protein UA08_07127 [Talaromyces atroroseus]|uniref:Xylanolytic transcriptional activator regulatory domain-containing protein n=1 Tax=Talaromyces atroroseus TaxID=1441469 RepID=A0A225ATH7_TALAT|nr:hypothetical protein UA08_07127 [Talaromyces atroroseus]OKL57725.1 hypothetical protein UA08_07127 [Talaromyces atroroseus]
MSPLSLRYLGPTSFAAEFGADSGSPDDLSIDSSSAAIENSNRLQPYWFEKIAEILMLLEDFSSIERLVSDFYALSLAPVIPAPFVLNTFPSIRRLCKELYTGVDFRLEILGIILSQAGRSTQFGIGFGTFAIRGESYTRMQLARRMYSASEVILQVCETLWGQLGDLSTRIFALGVHRETQGSSSIPPFLAQMRKRLFSASYRIDKNIATFLGRPPRLSSKHSDCGLPLCIDDDMFNASTHAFNQAINDTDEQGWRVQPTFCPTAWIRLQCSIAMFREEILDISIMPLKPETVQQLHLSLSRICGHMRNIYVDLTPSIRLYGFPAAGVLIEALHREVSSGITFEFPIPRPEILRNLCVFVAHIESAEQPRNRSDTLFKRASKHFASVIDEVIGSKLVANNNSLPSNTHESAAAWDQDDSMDFMRDFIQVESMDFGIMFDQLV